MATSSSGRITMREVNRLALPAILSGIAEPVIALVDSAFVGHIGTEELGAIGIGSSLFLLFVWVLTQTKTAISAIVSQHYGADSLSNVKRLIPQALWSVALLGLVVYWLTDYFSIDLLKLYSAKGEVLLLADSYFSIRCIGFPIVLVTYTIFGIFRGVQNTVWAMYISIGGALVNLVMDILLIFGLGDLIPEMGIVGAAWASLIAQGCMLIASVFVLLRNTDFGLKPSIKLHPDYYRMMGLSSNFIIRTAALNVTFFFANRYATSYGSAHIAAHTIAVNIWLFSSYFIDGYANAGNALAGRLIGRGDMKELYRIGRKLLGISMVIGLLLGLVYLLGYPWIGSRFSDDPEVLSLFAAVFWMVIIAQPLNAIAFSLDGLFKGLGEARYLMVTLLIASFIGFLPIIIISDYLGWGLQGIWAAFILFMAIRGGSLWWRFNRKYGLGTS